MSFIGKLVGQLTGAQDQADAASAAAGTQAASAQAGIEEQRRQFDAIRQLLAPYVTAGYGGLNGQLDLAGINGTDKQQAQIDSIKNSPQFTSILKQGENSILANASATGGLRGGNTQAALAQFSPQLLSQLINDQYTRLGGLTRLGQSSAVGTGNAGMAAGNNISNLLQQQGAATAGGQLAQGGVAASGINAIGSGLGLFKGLGGVSGIKALF